MGWDQSDCSSAQRPKGGSQLFLSNCPINYDYYSVHSSFFLVFKLSTCTHFPAHNLLPHCPCSDFAKHRPRQYRQPHLISLTSSDNSFALMSSSTHSTHFPCPSCTYRTSSSFNLKRHIQKCRLHNSKPTSLRCRTGTRISHFSNPYHQPLPIEDILQHLHTPSSPDSDPTSNDKAPPPRQSVQNQVACTLFLITRRSGAKLVNRLFQLFNSSDFYFEDFKSLMKSVSDCKHLAARYTTSFFMENGLRETRVTTSLPSNHSITSTLYLSNPISIIEKQLRVLHHFDALQFCPPSTSSTYRDQATNGPLHTEHFSDLYNRMRSHIISSADANSYWNDYDSHTPKSFISFL